MINYTYTPRAYQNFVKKILGQSRKVSPRGVLTHEATNIQLVAAHVNDRVITNQSRRMNLGFAIAEWVALMVGIDDINFFTPHIRGYDKYSTDGEILDGAYGMRNIGERSNQ